MGTKPLLKYREPVYPRIEIVFAKPDILLKNMPKAWQGNKLIVSAMITFSLSACRGQSDNPTDNTITEQLSISEKDNQDKTNTSKDSVKVAPIFVHGEGVGASGCVMVAPPAYLSEKDALNIIESELKKEGIVFKDNFPGKGVEIKRKKVVYLDNENIKNWEDRYKDTTETVEFKPDLYNKELNMVLEFVSMEDYDKFSDEEKNLSSVSTYPIKATAEKIQNTLKEKKEFNTVVFYDPVAWPDIKGDRNWDIMEKEGREKAVEMLKQQVDDFITWLKKEGFASK